MSVATNVPLRYIANGRKHILEYLEKQGYDIQNYSNLNDSTVNVMFQNNQLDMILAKEGEKVYVKFHLEKLKTDKLYHYLNELFVLNKILEIKRDKLIIISMDEYKHDTKKPSICYEPLLRLYEAGKFVTIFPIDVLQYNVLDHIYQPMMEILSPEESDTVKEMYCNDPSEFPEVSRFDPTSMAIGLRPGQICKYIRKSKSAGVAIYYRLCVNK